MQIGGGGRSDDRTDSYPRGAEKGEIIAPGAQEGWGKGQGDVVDERCSREVADEPRRKVYPRRTAARKTSTDVLPPACEWGRWRKPDRPEITWVTALGKGRQEGSKEELYGPV